jgi:putative transposase
LKQLTKALLERAMEAELRHELGFEEHDRSSSKESDNQKNGTSRKTVKSKHGEIELEVPREGHSQFEPVIIPRHQRRFEGFDNTIVSLYSRGLYVREIKAPPKRSTRARFRPS